MRIATWNLEQRWSDAHAEVLRGLDADLLLLTECRDDVVLAQWARHATAASMPSGAAWAAVLSRAPLTPLPDPHPASAAALVHGVTVCCSVLPWPRAGEHWPWGASGHQERMEETLAALAPTLAAEAGVWGGDWNQPLTGSLAGFTRAAREALETALATHGLQAPTAALPGTHPGQGSIDHVAVPIGWEVSGAGRVEVPRALSDHHACWIEVDPAPALP
ncbi:endonuclease/exonuclease/phosphatase family protein [Nocardioides sp.]|uniref:endonuclease/exonuclease/phosphatase family protein n=1 Tax=Nocardioides sp. TaxID=35761 RepID=UPI00351183B7